MEFNGSQLHFQVFKIGRNPQQKKLGRLNRTSWPMPMKQTSMVGMSNSILSFLQF
jgi:hypothetical protein